MTDSGGILPLVKRPEKYAFIEKNSEKMDGIFEAVVEGFDKWAECYFGRTAGDAPDIDGKIFFTSDEKLEIGQYVTVKITDTLDYDLIGEVISNESSK